jgi:hypothetical protein
VRAARRRSGGPHFDLPLERTIVLENKERATARQVFAILGGRRINHHSFICHCPCGLHAHGDRNPSLSVRDGDRGRLLLHCFAGGNYDEVVAGLRAKGLRR